MEKRSLHALLRAIVMSGALVVGGCGGSSSSGGGTGGSSGTGGTSVADAASGTGGASGADGASGSGGASGADGASGTGDALALGDDTQDDDATPPAKPACADKDGKSCTGTVEFCMGDSDSVPCDCKDGKWACHPFCGSTCSMAGTMGQCYDADPTVAPVACSCVAVDMRSAWTCK